FAFGAITATDTVFGDEVPIAFEAVERHGDKDFYEYDPIGYVTENGSVILYDHYKTEFTSAPTSYMPKDHSFDKMAQPTPTGHGYSPYKPLNSSSTDPASEEDQKNFKDEINKIKDSYQSGFKYRDYSGYMVDGTSQIDLNLWKAGNYTGKSLKLYTYTFETASSGISTDAPNIKVVIDTYYNSGAQEIKTYKVKTITSKYKAIYENIADSGDTVIVSLVKVNNKDSISFDGTSLDPDFKDYEPIFTDRVAGATFFNSTKQNPYLLETKDVKYVFSSDGSTFTLTYKRKDYAWSDWADRTYIYTLARFDNNPDNHYRAVYEYDGAYYWVELSSSDNTIKSAHTGLTISGPGIDTLYEAYRETK
ncbi:hypothetical protein E6A51_09210, partial [Brachyspira hampsonii]|nr:hypothetical protein [Brachyspira hampsonii]